MAVMTGRFRSVDELSTYVAAVDLVDRGQAHVNPIGYALWALRPGEQVTQLGADGNVYTKKSPIVIALMVPLVLLGRVLPAWGTRRAVLFLGPLLTAGTAITLYGLARKLRYGRRVATAATLGYALCSLALPYAQTVFGELVAAFGLLLALYGVLDLTDGGGSRSRWGGALLCGLGVASALGANAVYLLVVPLFGLGIVLHPGVSALRERAQVLARYTLPVALAGGALLLYNRVRFDTWWETGYRLAAGQEGFTTPLWWGIPGLLISPARGLLWYSPPSWLVLLGWRRFHRSHARLSAVMLAAIAVQLVAFGAWWQWWGGWGWGPRFLLPLVPYVTVAGLPMLQSAYRGRAPAKVAITSLMLFGFAVQVGGVALDGNAYETELAARFPAPTDAPLRYHHDPGLVYDVARSPILEHWRRLATGPIQLVWWPGNRPEQRWPSAVEHIAGRWKPGDSLIFTVPEALYELLEWRDMPPMFGLPYNPPPDDPLPQVLLDRALREAERAWLLTQYGPGDPANGYEAQLREGWASVSDEWVDGLRLTLLARAPERVNWQDRSAHFDGIRLSAYDVQAREETLYVSLAWQVAGPVGTSYTAFVHVFDSQGQLVAGQDRLPLGGYKPTTRWTPGEVVVDHYAFFLTETQAAGVQVTVGWYEWPSLERLSVSGDCPPSVEEHSCLLSRPQ